MSDSEAPENFSEITAVDLMRQAIKDQRKLMEKIGENTEEIRSIALQTQQDLAVFRATISGEYNLIKQRLDAVEAELSKLSQNHDELRDQHIEELKKRVGLVETEQKISNVKVGALGAGGGTIAVALKALYEWIKGGG